MSKEEMKFQIEEVFKTADKDRTNSNLSIDEQSYWNGFCNALIFVLKMLK